MELSMFVAPGETSDIRELAEQTMALCDRLLEPDVDGVHSVRQAGVPASAQLVDAFAMGSVQVTLSPAALPAVIGLVRQWLANRPVPSVRMAVDGDVLKVGRTSSRKQRQLVDAFLQRHSG